MRFEIVIFLITIFVVANIYTDGKYLKVALSWKKYYQMIGVAFFGYMLCWLMRKSPEKAQSMLVASNEYLKYFPLLKSREKLYVQDQIWKKICGELNYEIIPSL